MVTSVPPYKTFSLIKTNILRQSKIYKNQKFLIYLSRMEKYRNPHGQSKENLFLPLYTDLPINYRFDNMQGKAQV
jgi:hypothetical protein